MIFLLNQIIINISMITITINNIAATVVVVVMVAHWSLPRSFDIMMGLQWVQGFNLP